MITRTIKILMTDDHPMIIEGYRNTLLATKNASHELVIETANNCDESLAAIQQSIANDAPYDMVFFDISIPPSSDGKYKSGYDLAKYVRDQGFEVKVVILTMFNEAYRIKDIINKIAPDGFLIKSDLTARELASAFHVILTQPPFYSKTIKEFVKKMSNTDFEIDATNLKILHLLSQGIKTKNIKDHIQVSLSTVEKRKKHLRELFSVVDSKDESLLKAAKKHGVL